jgi:hypothetical protein
MFPEGFIIAIDIDPEFIHVRKQIRLSVRLKNGSDVGVSTARVTIRVIGPIAMIRPKSVDGPGV